MRSVVLIFLIVPVMLLAQENEHQKEWEAYWDEQVTEFQDEDESPLKEADRKEFIGFGLFGYNPEMRVIAKYTPLTEQEKFKMKTSGERRPLYVTVGKLEFTISGIEEELYVYRNIELSRNPVYSNYLFVPFTDLTNGSETYGGGRYLDFEGPLGTEVAIDFNKAYNPYCAYNDRYSCPIPPKENHLELEIKAGVLAFKQDH